MLSLVLDCPCVDLSIVVHLLHHYIEYLLILRSHNLLTSRPEKSVCVAFINI